MKITCSQQELLKGLNIVNKAVPTRTTMSILECILIDASATDIRLTANDMEIGIETIIEGNIHERGKVALEAKMFVDMIRNLPSDHDVSIESDEKNNTKINCSTAHFDIAGKSGDDFPNIPVIPRNVPIEISQFTFRETIRQTFFSTADNDANKMMTGELFEVKEDNMRMASLDGHRISVRNVTLKKSYDNISVVIPGKSLNELSKIMNGTIEDMMSIYITENHVIFEYDNTTMVSRLIDGEFFNIDQMMSTDYETKISINKNQLESSISRSILLTNDKDKKPIIIDIADQDFHMYIRALRGNFDENLPMTKEGRDIKIAFNPKFLMDALRAIDDETVDIYMISPKSPCFIRDSEEKYIYLILPVNFNG